MVSVTENNKYIYPLTPQSRGQFVISDTDPNNTPLGLAKLKALYGAGNVIVLPHDQFLKYVGSQTSLDLVSLYSSENFNPLTIATSSNSSTSGVTSSLPAGAITLPAPTNLKLGTPQTIAGTNGTNTISVPVFFNPVSGAAGYEITYSTANITSSATITGVITSQSTSGQIVISWNAISNATNYTFTATNLSTNQYTSVLVIPPSGATTITESMSVPSGSYKVTITPYNSNGYAGTSYTTATIIV